MKTATKIGRTQKCVPFVKLVVSVIKAATAIEAIQNKVKTCESSSLLRLKPTSFTRHRKLIAAIIVTMLLRRIAQSLQLETDAYFAIRGEEPVSKQAFSKARANLNPMFVRSFVEDLSALHAQDEDAQKYLGMRLIAIDGTDIALENSAELKAHFGCSGSKKDAATALGSLAYGPLDNAIYDCQIAPYAKDERDLAKLHMARLIELKLEGSLLLFDRWYPSAEFIAYTLNAGFSFVMRVREKWNLDADAIEKDGWITLSHKGQTMRIRVLKVKLQGGEIETLLTNLDEKQLKYKDAADLYFKRWGIETAFDLLKSKLQLENFSGKTVVSVLQDFYATVFLGDFAMICAAEANALIEIADKDKKLKYHRKSSQNRTIAKLRHQFYSLLLEDSAELREEMLESLFRDIAARPVPIRPDRHPPHKAPRKKRFHMSKKAVIP